MGDDSGEKFVQDFDSSCSNEDTANENDDALTPDDAEEDDDAAATVEANAWGQVTAQQRVYPVTGKEELLMQPTSTGSQGSVTPLDVHALFFTEDIVSDIVAETNRFASQVLDSHRYYSKVSSTQMDPNKLRRNFWESL